VILMAAIYLIRIGELSLKGENRIFFEKKLKSSIRKKVELKNLRIKGSHGRFYVETEEENAPLVEHALSHTFGISAYSRARRVQKSPDMLRVAAVKTVREMLDRGDIEAPITGKLSFKVESRRTDKSYVQNSYEINCDIGETLLDTFDFLKVDVKKPDFLLFIEIREEAFVYGRLVPGLGGLPTGTAGKAMLMLSGGIDSPVAGFMMAGRGLKLDFIYFHTYPYTSDEALDKVKKIASLLAPFVDGANLFVVPFTKPQLRINERSLPQELTLLMRAAMVKIATGLATRHEALGLVTGESLSQVASQTMESIAFTGSMTPLPVFRPLIGLDKEEIIRMARRIGTYETSILPYDDCCTVFSTAHPLLHPKIDRMTNAWNKLEIEDALTQALDNTERIYIHPIYGM
jgi:thiamine biosynthesis protein ThiI